MKVLSLHLGGCLRLKCEDARLDHLLRTLEVALQSVGGLSGQELTFQVMGTTADNREGNPAGWRKSTGIVEVYDPEFFGLSPDVQLGVLAHEVGEYAAATEVAELSPVSGLLKDFQADYFACLIGFEEQLVAGRLEERGDVYVAAVRSWRSPSDFVERMTRWRYMRNATII